MSQPDIALCAAGEATWHAAASRAHGVRWRPEASVARADRFVHRYLLGAITLSPESELPDGVFGPVRDSFGSLRLSG